MRALRVKHVLFYAAPFVVAFVVLECALRLAGYRPRQIHAITGGMPSASAYFWVADAIGGFRNRPNGYHRYTGIQGSPVVTTDKYGYRTSYSCALPRSADRTVVFVGDSTSFCAEVNDLETGPSEVGKRLCSIGVSVRIINAGVRGYNTLQSKRMLTEALARFPSTRLVVYVYCDNDLVENMNPAVHYPVRAPIALLREGTDEMVEKEVEAQIVPWGHSFQGAAVPPIGWSVRRVINSFIGFSRSALLEFGMSSATSVLDGAEWKLQEIWAKQHGGEKILEKLLSAARVECTSRGAQFIVTRFATGESERRDKWLAEICRRAQAKFVAISGRFTGDPEYFMAARAGSTSYDFHYGPHGTRTFAEAISSEVESVVSVGSR